MASFYNAETSEPVNVMYIGSSQKGNVVLKAAGGTGTGLMGLPWWPQVIVANGSGVATPDTAHNPGPGEFRWNFTGLSAGASVVAVDGQGAILAQIPVKRIDDCPSYRWISERFHGRGMNIDLDSHIDYVCYGSDIIGEGIAFRPKSAADFTQAILDTRLFHHDDRSDFFGKKAAAATIGEGYREVSTPSLHVAISSALSSVHIDSYAFMLHGPTGDVIIGPDVGQHIFDELIFRMPMSWLRSHDMPFVASVLQALHPILPNSTNRYSPQLGLRLDLGTSPSQDLRSGVPRLSFEAKYDVGLGTQRRVNYEANLRLLTGGNPDRSPDWTVNLRMLESCRDVLCRDRQETVGLFFTVGRP